LYAIAHTVENMLGNPDFAIQLLQKYKEERKVLKKKDLEDKPKVLVAVFEVR
jgi:hypothetical protein